MLRHLEKIVLILLVVGWIAGALIYVPKLGEVDRLKSESRLASTELESLLDNVKAPPIEDLRPGAVRNPLTARWRAGVGAKYLRPSILGERPRKEG